MSFGTSLRRYYRGDELVAMVDNTGAKRYYHFDHQGTTQCLTDGTGAVTDRFASDAWGVQVKRTGSSINRQWYVGMLGYYSRSAESEAYVRCRWLAPVTGRWESRDLVTTTAPYVYGTNSPSRFVDPGGLESVDFEFNAFIPGRLGDWLWEPFSVYHQFRTDQRGFGGGAARIHCRGTIVTDTLDVTFAKCWCDPSYRRTLTQPFQTWYYWPPRTAPIAGTPVSIIKQRCAVTVIFMGSAVYPFIPSPPSPPVDFTARWGFAVWKPGKLKVTLSGAHDQFPNYEGLAGQPLTGAHRQVTLLYAFDTVYPGPDESDLNDERPFPSTRLCLQVRTPPSCCGVRPSPRECEDP